MHIMLNTEQGRRIFMNEKLFKSIKNAGGSTLALGIVTICVGIATGVLLILNGAKMLAAKSDTLF